MYALAVGAGGGGGYHGGGGGGGVVFNSINLPTGTNNTITIKVGTDGSGGYGAVGYDAMMAMPINGASTGASPSNGGNTTVAFGSASGSNMTAYGGGAW